MGQQDDRSRLRSTGTNQGAYSYRRWASPDGGRVMSSRQAVEHALEAQRQALIQTRNRIRTLTAARNEAAAQAIEDGVSISTVAAAIGESISRVRSISLSFDIPERTSTRAHQHILELKKAAKDFDEAVQRKAALEKRLQETIAVAYRLGMENEAQLASRAGVAYEMVHKTVRALRAKS